MGSFLEQRRLETDVLVFGGGAAGAMAAIRARESGCRPVVMIKGPFPSGSSVMARSGLSAALGHADAHDRPELHLQDTLAVGSINDEDLARILAGDIVPIVDDMERWGVDLVRKDGKFEQLPLPDHRYPRGIHHYDETGKAVMDCLAKRARELQIETTPSTMLLDLIVGGGRVTGAIALNYAEGALIEIAAKAVVLATGGGGHAYRLSDMPGHNTGDGQAAAWRAGAAMIDIEFVEFQLAVCNPGLRGYPPASTMWLVHGGRLYNGGHERFMKRYPPRMERQSRSTINQAVVREILEGRGTAEGGVYLDLSHLSAEDMMGISPAVFRRFRRAGIDLTYQPMQVAPGCHSFLGGIKIDADGGTNLPGLFAGGEVAGGVHGADRLGGNALTNALVFGARAGAAAARTALAQEAAYATASTALGRVNDDLEAMLEESEGGLGARPAAVIEEIRQAMAGAEVLRTEASLRQTLDRLAAIGEHALPGMAAGGHARRERLNALREAIEARNLALVGELIATAALMRQESRGFHCRIDFPATDDVNWRKSTVLYRSGEGIGHRFIARGAPIGQSGR